MTEKEKNLTAAIEDLDKDIEELDKTIEDSFKHYGFWRTFLRGVIGALGALVGASLVLAGIIYILQVLSGTPLIGDLFEDLLTLLQQNK